MRVPDSGEERVSVIIPARNEEANIRRVVESVALQTGVREIIVVDDQSTDATPAILTGLATKIPRLRVLRVDSLPEGWLGKTHALAMGACAASSEWLLFTDADTEHRARSLAELLQRAEDDGADLLSLSPGQDTPTWWEKAVIPYVYVKLGSLFRFEDVSDPTSPVAAANGQYILIRREVYQRAGGFEAIRGEVLDDVALASRVKAQGGKLIFLPGADWVRTRMYRTFAAMWKGWTKNLYLLYQRSTSRMLDACALAFGADVLPVLLFVAACGSCATFRSACWLVLATGLWLGLRVWTYARRLASLGFESKLAAYHPVGAALFGALLLSSLHAYRMADDIEWKGRHYTGRGQG